MLVNYIGVVLVVTLVGGTLNYSKRTVMKLVIVYLIDVEFLSASDVSTCDHTHIVHLSH